MSKSKKIIVGFLILLSLSFSYTATVTDPNLYDVIVVGGGVSGLSAMSALAKGAKINTLLLEGDNRLGGRAYTIPFGTNGHIELGAQWIHGYNDPETGTINPIWTIMNSLGQVMNYEFYGSWSTVMGSTQDGVSQSSFSSLMKSLEVIYDNLESSNLNKYNTSTSFGSLFDQAFKPKTSLENNIYQCYLRDQITGYACPSFYDLSARWIYYNDGFEGGNQDINIKDGFIKLVNYLSSSLNAAKQIRINELVSNIEYTQAAKSSGNITVTSKNSLTGQVTIYKCKHLVSSVSLNVLKNTKNLFTPQLPTSIATSLSKLRLGTNNKVFFVFNQNVFTNGRTALSFIWQNGTTFSLNADAACNGFQFYKSFAIWRVPPLRPNILFSEWTGAESIQAEQLSDTCMIQAFTELLKRFYPKIAFPTITQVIRSKWNSNPLFQGSYTYVPPGSSVNDINNLAVPINPKNKIYLIGEHTSTYTGTIHGAYMTGQKAAKQIISSLASG